MTRRYKHGDVICYSENGEAIVDFIDSEGRLWLSAWRDSTEPDDWVVMDGCLAPFDRVDVFHHPDPDSVLTAFAAWTLLRS